MKSSDIVELAENVGKSFIIDGSDESWSIFVDDLENGQFLVTLLLREDYSEQHAISNSVEELGKLVADIIYHNELE